MESGKINCSHTISQHLFHNICCNNQSTLKKIVNVVFNIFTLCIPLIIYRISSYFYEKKLKKVEVELEKVIEEINNRPIEKEYSQIGEEAINFAKQKLLKHKELFLSKKIPFLDKKFKPKNEAIAYLTKIYFHYYKGYGEYYGHSSHSRKKKNAKSRKIAKLTHKQFE